MALDVAAIVVTDQIKAIEVGTPGPPGPPGAGLYNAALLSTYTQTEVTLADAVTKKHAHANSATLARITEAANLPLWDGAAWPGGSSGYINFASPTAITGTAAITPTKGQAFICTLTSADATVTINPTSLVAGDIFRIDVASSSTKLLTIAGNTSQNIGPGTATSRVMWAGEGAELMWDGAGFRKVAGISLPMSASMYKSDGQLFSANVLTKILLNAPLNPSPSALCRVATNDMVALRGGVWQVFEFVTTNGNNSTAHRWQNQVRKNTVVAVNQTTYVNASGYDTSPTVGEVVVAAGDVIDMACYYMAGSYSTSAIYPGGAMLQIQEIPRW